MYCSATGEQCDCAHQPGCTAAFMYVIDEQVRITKDCQYRGYVGRVVTRYYPEAFGRRARVYGVMLPGAEFAVFFRASEMERV